MFNEALFTTANTWKQRTYPWTEEWIKKMWYIYSMEEYSPLKRMNKVICSNMDGSKECHNE